MQPLCTPPVGTSWAVTLLTVVLRCGGGDGGRYGGGAPLASGRRSSRRSPFLWLLPHLSTLPSDAGRPLLQHSPQGSFHDLQLHVRVQLPRRAFWREREAHSDRRSQRTMLLPLAGAVCSHTSPNYYYKTEILWRTMIRHAYTVLVLLRIVCR